MLLNRPARGRGAARKPSASPRDHLIVTGFVVGLLLLAGRHLLTPYSYWPDEMFSVQQALASWREFVFRWLAYDVHPPLYALLLRGWVGLWGSGEVATRSLSFLFTALALLSMAVFTSGRSLLARFIAIGVLGTAPAFHFYGQETRSYALLLALSTLSTLLTLRLRSQSGYGSALLRWSQTLVALALSLTHYFGLAWIVLLTLLQICRATCRVERRRAAMLLPLLAVWPLIHQQIGDLSSKTGGRFNSWIEVDVPFVATINKAIAGLVPGFEISRQPTHIVLWLLIIALLALLAWPLQTWPATWRNGSAAMRLALSQSLELVVLSLAYLGLISVIDLHTPISTLRNFIVLLPPLSLVLAGLAEVLHARLKGPRRLLLPLVVICFVWYQLQMAVTAADAKAFPGDNWKALASAVRALDICRDGCFSDFSTSYLNYYFQDLNILSLPARAPLPEAPLLLHKNLSADERHRMALICLKAPQLSSSPYLLLPEQFHPVDRLAAAGLRPCS